MALGSLRTTMLGRMIKFGPCFRCSLARYLWGFPRRLASTKPYSDHRPSNFGVFASVSDAATAASSSAVGRVKVAVVSFDGLVNSRTGQADTWSSLLTLGVLRYFTARIEDTGAIC